MHDACIDALQEMTEIAGAILIARDAAPDHVQNLARQASRRSLVAQPGRSAFDDAIMRLAVCLMRHAMSPTEKTRQELEESERASAGLLRREMRKTRP